MPWDFITQLPNLLLISLVVISGASLISPLFARGGAKQVSPGQATLLINREDAHVIDVREAEEFARGHLPEARNFPLSKLADRIGDIEKHKDKPLVVCCAAGMRSGKACTELKKLGFANVVSLAGGVDAWVAAGYPVKKGTRNK